MKHLLLLPTLFSFAFFTTGLQRPHDHKKENNFSQAGKDCTMNIALFNSSAYSVTFSILGIPSAGPSTLAAGASGNWSFTIPTGSVGYDICCKVNATHHVAGRFKATYSGGTLFCFNIITNNSNTQCINTDMYCVAGYKLEYKSVSCPN